MPGEFTFDCFGVDDIGLGTVSGSAETVSAVLHFAMERILIRPVQV